MMMLVHDCFFIGGGGKHTFLLIVDHACDGTPSRCGGRARDELQSTLEHRKAVIENTSTILHDLVQLRHSTLNDLQSLINIS